MVAETTNLHATGDDDHRHVGRRRVAVVTGANKGIGLAIVKVLCEQFDGDVILTSRNVDLGKAALTEVSGSCNSGSQKKPVYHQLDITDHESIVKLHDFLQSSYGGLDVLINNAAIAYPRTSDAPFAQQSRETIKINFSGTLDVCRTLFPLLRPHARVVNMSSRVGNISVIGDEKIKAQLLAPTITMQEVVNIMQQFVDLSQTLDERGLAEHGFRGNRHISGAYPVSKVGVTIMTRILQREIDAARPDDDILVNAACPGYINTDMTRGRGWGTVEQGADTAVYLALLPAANQSAGENQTQANEAATNPRGAFVAERRVIDYDTFQMSLTSLEMWRVGGRMVYNTYCNVL